jgi:pyruvate/2-oxoacid:ferredoxin oxidoreductase alpha subunit
MPIKAISSAKAQYEPIHDIPFTMHGPAHANITLICNHALTSAAIEAAEFIHSEHTSTNALVIHSFDPFPATKIAAALRSLRHILLIQAHGHPDLNQLLNDQLGFTLLHQIKVETANEATVRSIIATVRKYFII